MAILNLSERKPILLAVVMSLLLVSCSKDPDPKVKPAPVDAVSNTAVTDQWTGQWQGPEGTFLKISGDHGRYDLTIQSLDGPTHYAGQGIDNQITFERDGVKESIHASNGEQTGMKWLVDKSNCLTIRLGEGFCRD